MPRQAKKQEAVASTTAAPAPAASATKPTPDTPKVFDDVPLTKCQRRHLKEKQKKLERRANAEAAGVDLNPKDPQTLERNSILKDLQKRFQDLPRIGDLHPSDAMSEFQSQRRELDQLCEDIRTICHEQATLVKKPDPGVRKETSTTLKSKINESCKSSEIDQSHLSWLSAQLAVVLAWENYKKFLTGMQELQKNIDDRKRLNQREFDASRDADRRSRTVERVKYLKMQKNPDVDIDDEAPLNIISKQIELPPELIKLILVGPGRISRKLESSFSVAIEQGGPRNAAATRGRSITLWGVSEDVEALHDFVKNIDVSPRSKIMLDRSTVSALIGKQGAGIKKVEEDHNCFITIDNSNEVFIIGSKDSVNKVLKVIQQIRLEAEKTPQTVTIPNIPTHTARAIQALMSQEIRTVETEYSVYVRVYFGNVAENEMGSITIRGKAEGLQGAKNRMESVLALMTVEEVDSDNATLSKLFGVGGGDTPGFRDLANAFAELRERSRVIIVRLQVPSPKILVVGEKEDVKTAREEIEGLLVRANYTPVKKQIVRQQLRIFTVEQREQIQLETGASFSFAGKSRGGDQRDATITIELVGSESQTSKASELIDQILEKEGFIDSYTITMDQTILYFVRERFLRLQEMENCHKVVMSLDKPTKTLSVMGSVENVKECIRQVMKMDKNNERLELNTTTKSLTIDPAKARHVVGPKGRTVASIKETSGVLRIEVVADKVTLKGTEEQITVAENLVLEAIESEGDRMTGVRRGGGGRGGPAQRTPPPQKPQAPPMSSGAPQIHRGAANAGDLATAMAAGGLWGKQMTVSSNPKVTTEESEDSHFPTLGASLLEVEEKRGGRSRRRGGNSGSPTSTSQPLSETSGSFPPTPQPEETLPAEEKEEEEEEVEAHSASTPIMMATTEEEGEEDPMKSEEDWVEEKVSHNEISHQEDNDDKDGEDLPEDEGELVGAEEE